jgi:hypothetical protein
VICPTCKNGQMMPKAACENCDGYGEVCGFCYLPPDLCNCEHFDESEGEDDE